MDTGKRRSATTIAWRRSFSIERNDSRDRRRLVGIIGLHSKAPAQFLLNPHRGIVDRLSATHDAAKRQLDEGAAKVTSNDVDRAQVYLRLARAKHAQAAG